MIDKKDRGELISNIFTKTASGEYEWFYLDSNVELYEKLSLNERRPLKDTKRNVLFKVMITDNFEHDSSFYTIIKGNYIVLVAYPSNSDVPQPLSDRLELFFVPRTYKGIESIEGNSDIVDLHTEIKSKFPSVQDIIKDILS